MSKYRMDLESRVARAIAVTVHLAIILVGSFACGRAAGSPSEMSAPVRGVTDLTLRDVATIHLPQGALPEGTVLSLASAERPRAALPEGERLVSAVVHVAPDDLAFRKPVSLRIFFDTRRLPRGTSGPDGRVSVALHNGYSWIRVGDAAVDTEKGSVSAEVYHGGEFVVLVRERDWGIVEAPLSRGATPIIVVSGLPMGRGEWADFERYSRTRGMGPVWTFEYPLDQGVERAAQLLAAEVSRLSERHGSFQFDLVGHGVGGLVALRFGLDPELCGERIARAIITLGTPTRGTEMADEERVLGILASAGDLGDTLDARELAVLFSLLEAMGRHRSDLLPNGENEVLTAIEGLNAAFRRKAFTFGKGGCPRYRVECLSGSRSLLPARLAAYGPAEIRDGEGDTYISVASTLLTPIEDAPFAVDHFRLIHRNEVFDDVLGYIGLGGIAWPELFESIGTHEGRLRIVDVWEKEFLLNQGDERSLAVLLDLARNFLRSTERDAILFTNGDNDTYPLWYVQVKDSIRPDVAVANLSLLNTSVFIKYLKGDPHRAPITLSDAEIDSLRAVKEDGRLVRRVSDQVVGHLIEENGWERPLYYAVTLNPTNMALFDPHRRILEGLVYHVLPAGPGEEPSTAVDVDICLRNLEELYSYEGLFDDHNSLRSDLDPDLRMIISNYAALYFAVGEEFQEQDQHERAMTMFRKGLSFAPGHASPRLALAELSLEMGEDEEAEHWYREAFRADPGSFSALEALARYYFDHDRRAEGMRILARWLERHPDDERVLELMTGAPVQ